MTATRIFPFQVALPARSTGLREDSKALAEQVRSVAAERLSRKVAAVPPDLVAKIDDALRLHLAL